MSWLKHHEKSGRLASRAQIAAHEDRRDEALKLYAAAAAAEDCAVEALDKSKTRTLGISVVSAASLYYKAKQFERAKEVADDWKDSDQISTFARGQLKLLLHDIQHAQVAAAAQVAASHAEVQAPPSLPPRMALIRTTAQLREDVLKVILPRFPQHYAKECIRSIHHFVRFVAPWSLLIAVGNVYFSAVYVSNEARVAERQEVRVEHEQTLRGSLFAMASEILQKASEADGDREVGQVNVLEAMARSGISVEEVYVEDTSLTYSAAYGLNEVRVERQDVRVERRREALREESLFAIATRNVASRRGP